MATRQSSQGGPQEKLERVMTVGAKAEGLTCISLKVTNFLSSSCKIIYQDIYFLGHWGSSSYRSKHTTCTNRSLWMLIIKQNCFTNQVFGLLIAWQKRSVSEGNVHTGAAPPWLSTDDTITGTKPIGPTLHDYQKYRKPALLLRPHLSQLWINHHKCSTAWRCRCCCS